MTTFPTSKRKPQPRYAKLDGKPQPRPRGRHAASSPDAPGDKRETITLPPTQRLGFRVTEFAAMTGVSTVTIWRQVRAGKIKTVTVGNIQLIPRAHAIQSGLITSDDNI